MSYPKRKFPSTGLSHDSKFWDRVLDSSQKVAVYWVGNTAEDVTVVDYYDTVSEANAAALESMADNGAIPKVAVNWWHSDIATIQVGAIRHPDAREDLPEWIDATPI